MHILGGIILMVLVFWIVSRITGSKGAGAGAAVVTGVALLMLNSGNDSHHHHHKRLDYDA